jgi:hypothetical protein
MKSSHFSGPREVALGVAVYALLGAFMKAASLLSFLATQQAAWIVPSAW